MWPFKKREIVVDLTNLEKRGILEKVKKMEQKVTNIPTNSGYKDLRGEVDLFSAIARASSGSTSSSSTIRNPETAITNKVDDMEFRLDTLRKKIDDVLNRLEVVEKKTNVYGH